MRAPPASSPSPPNFPAPCARSNARTSRSEVDALVGDGPAPLSPGAKTAYDRSTDVWLRDGKHYGARAEAGSPRSRPSPAPPAPPVARRVRAPRTPRARPEPEPESEEEEEEIEARGGGWFWTLAIALLALLAGVALGAGSPPLHTPPPPVANATCPDVVVPWCVAAVGGATSLLLATLLLRGSPPPPQPVHFAPLDEADEGIFDPAPPVTSLQEPATPQRSARVSGRVSRGGARLTLGSATDPMAANKARRALAGGDQATEAALLGAPNSAPRTGARKEPTSPARKIDLGEQ